MAYSARSRALPLLNSAHVCPNGSLQWRPGSAQNFRASFSTTSVRPAKKPVPKRGVKQTTAKKTKRRLAEAVRPPAQGERRAMRKRVVLSNVNALEVPELQDIDAQTEVTAELKGKMLGLPGPLVDKLRAVEAFKPRQSWGMFRRPAFLVREETIELARAMEDAVGAGNEQRRAIVGERGSGKSVLLLQAMAMAFLKEWVVICIPETMDMVNAHTHYNPIPGTEPLKYAQKTYTAALLQRIVRANPILSTLTPAAPETFPTFADESGQRPSVADLVTRASADADLAWPTFQALWKDLCSPGRPPLLLTLDGLSKVMRDSEYRSAEYDPVHAHDLALVDWFVAALVGKQPLPNGGMVLGATSHSNTPPNLTFDLLMQRLEMRQKLARGLLKHDPAADPIAPFLEATGGTSDPIPKLEPFVRYDGKVLEALEGMAGREGGEGRSSPPYIQRASGLAQPVARSLMEYWAHSGMVRRQVNQEFVQTQWTLSGGGVVGELEKGCFKMSI